MPVKLNHDILLNLNLKQRTSYSLMQSDRNKNTLKPYKIQKIWKHRKFQSRLSHPRLVNS